MPNFIIVFNYFFYLLKEFSDNYFFDIIVQDEKLWKKVLYLMSKFPMHQKVMSLLNIQIIHLCTLTALQCTDFFSADSSVFWPFIESLQNCFKTELNCKNVSFLDNRNILRLFINIFGTFLGSQKSFFMRESL